jgi:uncharacterized protein involved in exopolysaccharide biosynthesis
MDTENKARLIPVAVVLGLLLSVIYVFYAV